MIANSGADSGVKVSIELSLFGVPEVGEGSSAVSSACSATLFGIWDENLFGNHPLVLLTASVGFTAGPVRPRPSVCDPGGPEIKREEKTYRKKKRKKNQTNKEEKILKESKKKKKCEIVYPPLAPSSPDRNSKRGKGCCCYYCF